MVECTRGSIVSACGTMYLARHGAEVILIESRKNRITGRITGPSWLPEDLQLIQGDLNPLSGDTGHQQKLSAAIEVTSPEGRKLLRRLLEVSDVFVSSLSAPTLPKWGPTYEELSKVNPGIIYLSVPGFGNTPGPYYESVTYGPALAAMAGLEGITGWPDRPASGIGPISLPDWTGAHHLAIAVVSALLHRQKTGVGQYIDMSQFEVAISCFGSTILQYAANNEVAVRRGNRSLDAAPHGVFPCRGHEQWVAIAVTTDDAWQELARTAGHPEWAEDIRFQSLAGRLENQDELEELVESWTSQCTPREVAYQLQGAGVPAAPVLDNDGIMIDPQLEARGYWRLLDHARLGKDLVYGHAIHLSETPPALKWAHPSQGQHTEYVLRDVLGLSEQEVQRLVDEEVAFKMLPLPNPLPPPLERLERPYWNWIGHVMRLPWPGYEEAGAPEDNGMPSPPQPKPGNHAVKAGPAAHPANGAQAALQGYRVLDLSDETGSYGAKLLADLGADVIKVEPPEGSGSRHVQPFLKGRAGPERSIHHLYTNTSKRSITLRLEHPDGAELFRSLVRTADVVYETYPPQHLDRLGLGWEELRRLNPSLVLTSLTPYGQTGPYRDWKAANLTLWAMSGALYQCGDPDRAPLVPGGQFSRIYGSTNAAYGTLAALMSRGASGEGQWVDVSIHESLMGVSSEVGLAVYLDDNVHRERMGSRRQGYAPVFHSPTEDGAVYLLALKPDHWDRLAEWVHEKTGIEEVLDPMFKGPSTVRFPYVELVEHFCSELTKQYKSQEFFEEADRRGITVGPVNTTADLMRDPHLAARSFWLDVDHPESGVLPYAGPPYRHSETPATIRRPAPLLGQHNDEVYRGELGFTGKRMQALRRAGVI